MEINREFYAKVLNDYLQKDEFEPEVFICNKSEDFGRFWKIDNHRFEIRTHVQTFIKENNIEDVFISGIYDDYDSVLFCNYSEIEDKELRKMFLKWASENI